MRLSKQVTDATLDGVRRGKSKGNHSSVRRGPPFFLQGRQISCDSRGRDHEAIPLLKKAIRIAEKASRESPSDTDDWHSRLTYLKLTLAETYESAGYLREALKLDLKVNKSH